MEANDIMARLYPDAMQDIALNSANENGSINTPPPQDFNTPAMQGSVQQFLSDNLGEFVVVEFLIGTQTMVQKAGILYAVGTSVLTLYDEVNQTFVTCDIFSVKFVTFYLPGRRPWQMNNPYFTGQGGLGMGGFPGQSGMGLPGQDGSLLPSQGATGGCTGSGCGFLSTLGR